MSKHQAQVLVQWNGSFGGAGAIDSNGFKTSISLPKEFGGSGQGASPEDLLLSSIASCHLITLGIILSKNEVQYQSLSVEGKLITETAYPPAIEEVVLTLRIVTEISLEEIERLATKVDYFCLIGKVLKSDLKKTIHIIRQSPASLTQTTSASASIGF